MTISGSLKNLMISDNVPFSGISGAMKVVNANRMTGSNEDKMLVVSPGNWSSGRLAGLKVSNGLASIFFIAFAKIGPATITVGIATMKPYISVVPISALKVPTRAVGEGWGGRKPCVTES